MSIYIFNYSYFYEKRRTISGMFSADRKKKYTIICKTNKLYSEATIIKKHTLIDKMQYNVWVMSYRTIV